MVLLWPVRTIPSNGIILTCKNDAIYIAKVTSISWWWSTARIIIRAVGIGLITDSYPLSSIWRGLCTTSVYMSAHWRQISLFPVCLLLQFFWPIVSYHSAHSHTQVVGTKHIPQLTLYNTAVTHKHSTKSLEVICDKLLSFKGHIHDIDYTNIQSQTQNAPHTITPWDRFGATQRNSHTRVCKQYIRSGMEYAIPGLLQTFHLPYNT